MAHPRCGNCDQDFPAREKGYHRFSLDTRLPRCNLTAREALEQITSSDFTPIKSKRKGNFLCPSCWLDLANLYAYKESSSQFWGTTHRTGYIGKKISKGAECEDVDVDPTSTKDVVPTSSTPLRKSSSPGAKKSLFSCKIPAIKVSKAAKWNTIIRHIRENQYARAIKGLYNATKASKKHFHKFVKKIIRAEVKEVFSSDFPLCRKPSVSNIEDFSWSDTFERLDQIAPLLNDMLKSIATTPQNEDTLERGKKNPVNLRPQIGTALACLLHARKPRLCSLLQTLFSMQFWQGGLKRQTMGQLCRTGVCLSYVATLSAIDTLREGFDAAAKKCKADLESQLQQSACSPPTCADDPELSDILSVSTNISAEVNQPSDSDNDEIANQTTGSDVANISSAIVSDGESTDEPGSSPSENNDSTDTSMESSDHEQHFVSKEHLSEGDLQSEVIRHPGFTLCWDNVGKKVTTRHPSSTTTNNYVNVALAYLTVNRIPSSHLNSTQNSVKEASEIPKDTFIAKDQDFAEIRNRICVIIERILTRHIPWFQDNFCDCVIQHIKHQHSVASAQRSVLVNLGVFEENPCSTQGAIGIYERLLQYVPNVGEAPYPTVVFGDGLSCERGNDASNARCNGLNPWERLEGLEPAAQEFHKEMILLQDHFDEFFKGTSAAEKGTLFFIKNICNFRQVKSDIGENVSNSWELVQLTTEAFVVLLALQELGMKSKCDIPPNAPEDIATASLQTRKIYLERVSHTLVNILWHDVNTNALRVEDEKGDHKYCCDDDEKEENFIGCESRHHCLNGEWFHYSCANIDPESIPDEFYCSEECKAKVAEIDKFCYCRKDFGAEVPMIGCSAEEKCTGKEWYHYQCVGMTGDTVPSGDWYCSQECEDLCQKKPPRKKQKLSPRDSPKDHIYLYSLAMTWKGLNLLCRRDAVREGDGDAMMSHWLIDLVQFFKKRHVKYVILAHRLIAAINGTAPENVRQDLCWNRTVNYSGGIGRNLPADLTNEFLNRMFKDLLKDAHGHYTSQTLARCSQIIGPFREAMDVMFDSNISEKEVYRHRRRNLKTDVNVSKVVEVLIRDELFKLKPGRQHRSFPAFSHNENPASPGGFLPKMRELSEKLGRNKKIALNEPRAESRK